MARELDSEMLGRLQQQYREMSDGELLGLAASAGDLTDMAQEVLRGEMTHRNLKLEAAEEAEPVRRWGYEARAEGHRDVSAISSVVVGGGPSLDFARPGSAEVEPGETVLARFNDAIEVGQAVGYLEAAELAFRMEDVARPRSGLGMYDSPPVALNLIVAKKDRERAMAVLREKMGLFPLQEVEEADAPEDDGTVATLGTFGLREDADEVARVLEQARLWHRVTANPDGSAGNDDAWLVEVREVDLMEAGEVVEKAMNLPEE